MPDLGPFDGQHVGQADEAHLGRGVVGLAEVAEQPGGRAGEQEPAVALLLHHPVGRLGDVEGAEEVDVDDGPQVGDVQVGERLVPQDAGVVDDDVDRAEGVERGLDDGRPALGGGHRVVAGHGLAAGGL